MQEPGKYDANRAPSSCSDEGDTHSQFQLNAKLRDKLEKLAEWRIHHSLIEIPRETKEFRGGYATVSRAYLAPKSDVQGSVSESKHTAHGRPELRWSNHKFDSPSDTQVPEGNKPDEKKRQASHLEDGDGAHIKEKGKEPGTRNAKLKSGSQTPQRKIVAVKQLEVENDTDLERVLGLALRESEFLLGLSHSNVIEFEGFVEDTSKRLIWLVFPWEENGNLRDFLLSGKWEIPERISLIYDVAKGVEYLHSQTPPIYHGDLKSASNVSAPQLCLGNALKSGYLQLNVLVNPKYHAIITDFGSARRLANEDVSNQTAKNDDRPRPGLDPTALDETSSKLVFCASTNTLTLTCDAYTLRWAAPELLWDDKPSLACDIWALGWIAYEIMTNTIPFHDVSQNAAVVLRVIQGDLPSITTHARMSLIQALCYLMGQCWSPNPEKRPTAHSYRKSISWMPMIVPAPNEDMDTETSQARHSKLLAKLGVMYRRQGDYSNAVDCLTKALSICPTNGHSQVRASALWSLGEVHRLRDQYIDAIKCYSESLQIRTEIGDRKGEADCLWSLAEVHRYRDEESDSIRCYSESLKICTDIGDKQGKADALWGLAEGHRRQGDYTEAVKFSSEALQIRIEIGDRQGEADTLWSLAEVHRLRDEYSDAIKFYSESLKLCTDIGDKQGKADALWGLAAAHHDQGDYDAATRFYSESLQISTDIGDRRGRAEALSSLAQTHRAQGHRSEALSLYMEASDAFGEIGDSVEAADALREAADIRKRLEKAA